MNLLQRLAKLTLQKYKPGIIGVTGVVGKTVACEAVSAVLKSERRVRTSSSNVEAELSVIFAVLGNYSATGGLLFWINLVFKSLKNLLFHDRNYPEILILEYGVSVSGEIRRLLDIARPQVVVITAIGHVPVREGGIESPKSIAREIARLMQQLPVTGFVILNSDDEEVRRINDQTRGQVLKFGFKKQADLKITHSGETVNSDGGYTMTLKLEYGGNMIPLRLNNVVGSGIVYAAASAACVGIIFGLNLIKISESLSNYVSPPGRMRLLPGMRGSMILDDTYTSDPLSVEDSVVQLKKMRAMRKIVVLGDMVELRDSNIAAHKLVGEMAANVADWLITIGPKAKFIAEGALAGGAPQKSVSVCDDIVEARHLLEASLRDGDLVLIKGAEVMRLERLLCDIMREPGLARAMLVRQSMNWDKVPARYDYPE